MELNGVANIDMLVRIAVSDSQIDEELADKILKQLDYLNRYMMAIHNAIDGTEKEIKEQHDISLKILIPAWYEIHQNPERFPTNKERKW